MLIELQVVSQYDYFQRMVYGTSKLITENIKTNSITAKMAIRCRF
ncbi:hypothetical protein MTBBW1_1430049 [Desulfamplus magnetovallimortis]|uniref:Uncharacterized protein n=1 Tax=Desulfamplus magnetovallimortis TaxID=1246637 RepID=A0A1W1H877_9BACT|nr:hypothetical protein MTBBW1_1430049 [Desulfamplus magnetovallimortis]